MKKENKKQNTKLLKRFLPYYKRYKKTLILDLLCAALTTVCELILPLIARQITGYATEDIASLTARLIITWAAFYIASLTTFLTLLSFRTTAPKNFSLPELKS